MNNKCPKCERIRQSVEDLTFPSIDGTIQVHCPLGHLITVGNLVYGGPLASDYDDNFERAGLLRSTDR